jgi:hypothetical protein
MSDIQRQAATNLVSRGIFMRPCLACDDYSPVCGYCGAASCGVGCEHLPVDVADRWTVQFDREVARLSADAR